MMLRKTFTVIIICAVLAIGLTACSGSSSSNTSSTSSASESASSAEQVDIAKAVEDAIAGDLNAEKGQSIDSVTLEGDALVIKVNLGNDDKSLAVNRASAITDSVLELDGLDSVKTITDKLRILYV